MDKKLITELKKKLEEEKEQLQKQLLTFADRDKKDPNDYDTRYPDMGKYSSPDENAYEVGSYENLLALEHVLELHLQDVNSALEKINRHDNSYGKCEVCGKPIEITRLRANPAAKTCIKCSTKNKSETG